MKLTAQHRKRESGHSGSHQQGSLRSTTSSRNPHFARPASTKKAASATRPERIHPPPFFLTAPCDNTRSPGAFTLAHSSVFNLQPSDRGEPALSREKGNHEKETKSEGNKRKMIVQVYSAVNLLWFLCNSAVINFCQFVLWLLVRPFDNALYRRVMGYVCGALTVYGYVCADQVLTCAAFCCAGMRAEQLVCAVAVGGCGVVVLPGGEARDHVRAEAKGAARFAIKRRMCLT